MRWLGITVLLLTACKGGPNFERDGDVAWRAGRWVDAMSAYHNAGDDPMLVAKYADAAFRGGFLPEAVSGWRQLGSKSPTHAQEAATGLVRAGMAAERERNQVVLAAAIAALREVAPNWPLTRLARTLDGVRGLTAPDAAQVWAVMFAAAPDPAAASGALVGLGQADADQGRCEAAILDFESAARRSQPGMKDSVSAMAAPCELRLGLNALDSSNDVVAENWFVRATAHDPNSVAGRRALVGFGDARLHQGDLAAAQVAWRSVVAAPVAADSIFTLALERLQTSQAVTTDTTGRVQGWW